MGIVRRLLSVAAVVAVAAGSLAGCDWPEGTRYVDVVFEGYEATTGIPYRTTTTHTGEPITLRLDVYEPAGDTAEERPVIMWMFGGAWRAGDRNQLASYAQDSARRGYVGVTIDYRIRPEGGDLIAASNDAYEDTLAAIRWLQDHAEQFRIDPDAIVPAGYSAGAINALHALHRPADTPAAGAVAIAGMLFHAPSPDRGPSIVFSGTADTIVPPRGGAGPVPAGDRRRQPVPLRRLRGRRPLHRPHPGGRHPRADRRLRLRDDPLAGRLPARDRPDRLRCGPGPAGCGSAALRCRPGARRS